MRMRVAKENSFLSFKHMHYLKSIYILGINVYDGTMSGFNVEMMSD